MSKKIKDDKGGKAKRAIGKPPAFQPSNGLDLIDPRPNPDAVGEEQDNGNVRS